EISCMLIAQDGYTIEYYGFAGEVAIQVHNEILNKDLNDGSAVTGSNYYRHIGTTSDNFKHGVIYFYSNGTFKAIDGSGGGSVEQVQADWNETNVLAKSFIKNKPTIPNEVSVSATGFSTNEVNYITIGDDEYKIGGAELEYWE
ncbi:MAG: hypothetical protein KBS91_00420, partial [Firmicutes bacterium]|nr:hypothetical protein [Candidatus Caballimonas caccae]